jgi:hypothetical protein
MKHCFFMTMTMAMAILAGTSLAGNVVLVEAEGFGDLGGWKIDQQFMDQMGSPILLAHGMGVPVKDASTAVTFPAAGTYHLWVRTRDWVANFGAPGAPGKFQLLVDGKAVKTTFGTEGAKWHWQSGGAVEITKTKVTLSLHDLTGFDGRCDAIVFSSDAKFVPPAEMKVLTPWRRKLLGLSDKPEDAGKFDLVVIGGGIAGTCSAISGARSGLKVALIQDRPVLGGNNSSEVRVHLGGRTMLGPYPKLGGVVRELSPARRGNAGPPERYEDQKKLNVVAAEKNLSLFLSTHVSEVEKTGKQISAVIGRNIRTGKRLRFSARVFADCTGDGTVGFLAGADYRMGREGKDETGEGLAPAKADKMTMGSSVQWYSKSFKERSAFPVCPWAVQFTEENAQRVTGGEWNWETGMNKHQIDEFEEVRDYGMRVVYGNWAFLKNSPKSKAKYANRKLDWVAHIAGKRESRRLLGDVILTEQDVTGQKAFDDACVTTTWTIDLHYPHPKNTQQFPGREFRSIAKHLRIKPYPIPYRCLYSRNIDNLFMAGRDISVTHVALGTIRVMNTCGMMGEVVGMAAAICKEQKTTPRGVYKNHLDDLKKRMTKGVSKTPIPTPGSSKRFRAASVPKPPAWIKTAGTNFARKAKVTVSSCLDSKYKAANINDGKIAFGATDRWVSGRELPHTAELTWDAPQTISAVRIVNGWKTGGGFNGVMENFALQYHSGGDWKEIPGSKTKGNNQPDWSMKFKPIKTNRLRLTITAAPQNLARIWEIETYNLPVTP